MNRMLAAHGLACVALALPTAAQCPLAKWTEGSATGGDVFGASVTVDGDFAFVGEPLSSGGAGVVHVYERTASAWNETQVLAASDAAPLDGFGWSVDVEGNRALIGAWAYNADKGSAYVFERGATGWVEVAVLTDPAGAFGDQFGVSVSLSGDRALIGANGVDGGFPKSGAAYIFERDAAGWQLVEQLRAPLPAVEDYFGWSVSLSGDRVLVGCSGRDFPGAMDAGAAFVFEPAGGSWASTQELVASDQTAGDLFGTRVALDGDRALVGAWFEDPGGLSEAGSAYLFERSGTAFAEFQKLVPSPSLPAGLFGWSVDLDGDRLAVGAYGTGPAGPGAGLVMIFDRGPVAWTQATVLSALDADAGDNFGYAVAVSGDTVVVGAWHDDDRGAESGSAHVFSISGVGCPTLLSAPDVLSLTAGGTQTLALVTANPGQVYFLLGSASGSAPGTPVDGLLLPLNVDSYSLFTLLQANTTVLANTLGVLDASGEAQASFNLPAGLDPNLAGLVLHHAYLVVHPAGTHAVSTSVAVPLELSP